MHWLQVPFLVYLYLTTLMFSSSFFIEKQYDILKCKKGCQKLHKMQHELSYFHFSLQTYFEGNLHPLNAN